MENSWHVWQSLIIQSGEEACVIVFICASLHASLGFKKNNCGIKTLEINSFTLRQNKHTSHKQASFFFPPNLRPDGEIILLALFYYFSPQDQIRAWECRVISCVCSTHLAPDVPVRRGRYWSTAPVVMPWSQVGARLHLYAVEIKNQNTAQTDTRRG